ncbi:hypothetical protein DBR32_01425 [Taibaiella sp. KBW10]|uniref:hypothetical protein n=1 Tax=Taibaiella sp. KBW10 TaxID=2153357 RepID=UPI000F596DC5|nr:hypothetical protein [Taibaiella sp. KBW10]RQO32298.1 hypothetical protein DBR32_01425 [Taibaiella sp. KBW10]
MGLLLHHTTSNNAHTPHTTIELIADLDLYEQYSRELNILHKINYEPSLESVHDLMEKIRKVSKDLK